MTSSNFLFALLVMSLLGWLLYKRYLSEGDTIQSGHFRRRWHLRPGNPKDCPLCQGQHGHVHKSPEIIAWSQVKSQRGRRKELVSEGNAYPNQACAYYGITDQSIHALVGDGVGGGAAKLVVNASVSVMICQGVGFAD